MSSTKNNYNVVISGMSGALPECDDILEFKEKLYAKENMITIDNRKWPVGYKYKFGKETVPAATGKMTKLNRFDSRIFQVHSILANCSDNIIRKVLEPSYEAVLDAGINPVLLSGTNTGVYAAFSFSEAESIKAYDYHLPAKSLYILGSSKTMLSNRISYALNLTGPSASFATSWQGGIDALTMAWRHVAEGVVDSAIVGCSSNIVDPKLSIHFLRFGLLSPDGICRAFDENANGYGRSEAAIVFFLQREEDAKRSYGKIIFSDTYYFGNDRNDFMNVTEEKVQKSFDEIYSRNNVRPSDLSFIEMDACGIKKLEKIESNVVSKLFCKDRKESLLVGSVKSNIGHAEGAAAFASLAKTLFALDTDYIAPNMNLKTINKDIEPLVTGKLKVVQEKMKLPGGLVGINSIGINGAVGHVVIQQNKKVDENDNDDDLPRLIILCGRTEETLRKVIGRVEAMPLNKNFAALANNVYKEETLTHVCRGYTILPTIPNHANHDLGTNPPSKLPIWFVFTGMGSQWTKTGKDLMKIPVFAQSIEKCEQVMQKLNISVKEILSKDVEELEKSLIHAFVCITATQIALVDLLTAIGVKPDGIIGHSLGEMACGYADGSLTLEQTLLATYYRGFASECTKTIDGMMAAIGKGYEEMKTMLPDQVEIACHNSNESCTLTGPTEIVNDFVKSLKANGVFAKAVNVNNNAFHSKFIAPIAPLLMTYLVKEITEPKARSSIWVSTSVPECDWDKPHAKYCSAEYLTNNLLNPVLFEEGAHHIPSNAIVIEIAPHGLLQAILKRSLSPQCINIPLASRANKTSAVQFLLSAIGKLHINGCQVDVNELYPPVSYPVPRGTPTLAQLATWDHSEDWEVLQRLKEPPLSEEPIEIRLNKGTEFSFLNSYTIKGHHVVPPSLYLYLVWIMLTNLRSEKLASFPIVFENIHIIRNVSITLAKWKAVTILLQYGTGNFEVMLENDVQDDIVLMTGVIEVPITQTKIVHDDSPLVDSIHSNQQSTIYSNLKNAGYQLDDPFDVIKEMNYNENDCKGTIIWNENWITFLDSLMLIPMYEDIKKKNVVYPQRIRRLHISSEVFKHIKKGDAIKFHRKKALNYLSCSGIEMFDYEYQPLSLSYSNPLNQSFKIQSLQFVDHLNTGLQDLSSYLKFCLELVMENASVVSDSVKTKINIDFDFGQVSNVLKRLLKLDPDLKTTFSTIDYQSQHKSIDDDKYSIICIGDVKSEKGQKLLSNVIERKPEALLIRLTADFKLPHVFHNSYILMTKQVFTDKSTIMLFKKIILDDEPEVLTVNGNWKAQFMSRYVHIAPKTGIIFVFQGATDISMLLGKIPLSPRIRCLFIMDDEIGQFSPQNRFYKNLLQQCLPVIVVKNGAWGSYRTVMDNSSELIHLQENPTSTVPDFSTNDIRIEGVDVKYISYGKGSSSSDKIVDVTVEYSGLTESGKRVMGIANCNTLEPNSKPDPLLSWNVPKTWTLEDAVTVPYAYIQVYNILYIEAKDYISSVLVHYGDTLIGEACIALSLHRGYTVYVTVSDDSDAIGLLNKFPKLERSKILHNSNYHYETQLKVMTHGKGIDLVVNTLLGNKHREASINSLGSFGKYFELIDINNDNHHQVGLGTFINSTSFVAIPTALNELSSLPEENKREIQKLMNDGIQSGLVKPFKKQFVSLNDVTSSKKKDNKNEKGVKNIVKFDSKSESESLRGIRFNDNRSYIIIGGKRPNLCYELLEWLISKGARKFIISIDNFSVSPKLSHQINRLLTQKKATVVLSLSYKLENKQDAIKLVEDADKVAPLEAIFFVAMNGEKKLENMDKATRHLKVCHFINIQSEGLKVCEDRRSDGYSSIMINFDQSIVKLSTVLPQIEIVLSNIVDSPLLFDLIHQTAFIDKEKSFDVIKDHLPNTMEDWNKIGSRIGDTAYFIETTTLSPRYADSKHSFPVFIIPGVDKLQIQQLITKLLYPAFCSTLPQQFNSATTIATELAESLERIQPQGPVTLIGELWSGCVAIELANILQSKGRKIKLSLIEGRPSIWQRVVKSNISQLDENLLKHIQRPNCVSKSECESKWEDRLNNSLKYLREPMKSNIFKAVNTLRNSLLLVTEYKYVGEALSHVSYFKQQHTTSDDVLEEYCLNEELHQLEEEDYSKFIENPKLICFINDIALNTWL